jgi:hypothetical protein
LGRAEVGRGATGAAPPWPGGAVRGTAGARWGEAGAGRGCGGSARSTW